MRALLIAAATAVALVSAPAGSPPKPESWGPSQPPSSSAQPSGSGGGGSPASTGAPPPPPHSYRGSQAHGARPQRRPAPPGGQWARLVPWSLPGGASSA
jgi:hypothetical protein